MVTFKELVPMNSSCLAKLYVDAYKTLCIVNDWEFENTTLNKITQEINILLSTLLETILDKIEYDNFF